MSIKSFHLVKWSSWSLINEFHLNTLAVCSPLPSAELCHPGQPLLEHTVHCCQLFLGPWATMVRMVHPPPWLVHGPSAEARACPGYPYHCWYIPGAAWCSPGSSTSRTKVHRQILGKDPFSAGGPQKCISLAFTKLKQCFLQVRLETQVRFTGCWIAELMEQSWVTACWLTEPTLLPWEQRSEGSWTNPSTRPPVFGNA